MMISHDLDKNTGVLIVRPEGKLEVQDFQALSEIVYPYIEKKGTLSGLIIVEEKFPGWKDFSGMVEHMKFVRSHHTEIAKVALVTDSKMADIAESLGKHFVKATIKHFPSHDLAAAQRWIFHR
jgi:hypothetical protein